GRGGAHAVRTARRGGEAAPGAALGPLPGHAEPAGRHTETRSIWAHTETRRARRFGERRGLLCVPGAAETSRRVRGALDVVVCPGRVRLRGVKPPSPGSLRGGMSRDPTGTKPHSTWPLIRASNARHHEERSPARQPPPRSPRLRVR